MKNYSMTKGFCFSYSVFLVLVLLGSWFPGWCTQKSWGADSTVDMDRLKTLKQRHETLESALTTEIKRLYHYLVFYDQILSMRVAMGRQSQAAADEQLQATAIRVFKESYTPEMLQKVHSSHGVLITDFIDYVHRQIENFKNSTDSDSKQILMRRADTKLRDLREACHTGNNDPAHLVSIPVQVAQILSEIGQGLLPDQKMFASTRQRVLDALATAKITLVPSYKPSSIKISPRAANNAAPEPSMSSVGMSSVKSGIYLVVFSLDGKSGLWVMPFHGTGPRQICASEIDSPVWNPGGRTILGVKRTREGWNLKNTMVLIDEKGRETPTRLPFLFDSKWSPDGRIVIYQSGDAMGKTLNLFLADPLNSKIKPMTDDGISHGAKWSPDGKWIAYLTFEEAHRGVRVMDFQGRNKTRLDQGYACSWSPDSGRIAYLTKDENGSDIIVINRDGSRKTLVTRIPKALSLEWSPDGRHFLFTYVEKKGEDYPIKMGACQTDGSRQVVLTQPDESIRAPRWTPDGQRIIYRSLAGEKKDKGELWIIGGDGENRRQLTSLDREGSVGTFDCSPFLSPEVMLSWHPDANIPILTRKAGNGQTASMDRKSTREEVEPSQSMPKDDVIQNDGRVPKKQTDDLDGLLKEMRAHREMEKKATDQSFGARQETNPKGIITGGSATASKIPVSTVHKYNHMGLLAIKSGNWTGAEQAFRRAVELDPSNIQVTANLAGTLWKLGHVNEAMKRALDARKGGLNSHWVLTAISDHYIQFGRSLNKENRFLSAEKAFRKALKFKFDNEVAMADLAGTLYHLKKYRDARIMARRSMELGLKDHWVYQVLENSEK